MEASALRAPASLSRLSISAPLLRLRSDDQLLALFRAGADEAFNVLHDRYRQRLFAYVRQMLVGPVAPGRRGRAAGRLRARVRRAAGRRAPGQRARLALPRRPQPLHRPPAPADARARRRVRDVAHPAARPARGRPAPRGPAPPRDRRRPPARAAALGAADARDRRHVLRRPRHRARRHGAGRQVAARARAARPRRGRRGPQHRLRGHPRRPRGRLRPRRQGVRPRPPPHEGVRRLPRVPHRPARRALLASPR